MMPALRVPLAILGISIACGSSASAAFATLDVAGLEYVYGEQNFLPGTAINILFSPVQNRVGLLSIQSREDLLSILDLGAAQSPVINLIFVDTVDWCGFYLPAIVGCSSSRENTIVLESEAVASSSGTELLAHELGHLLGLRHVGGPPNLMSPSLNGDTSLTPEQVATIDESPFVQGFDPIRFIRINPIVVVPEPSVMACLLLSGIVLARHRRR